MNFSIWSTPSIAQFFTGNNLCKEKIGKLCFYYVYGLSKRDLSGFNIIDSNILSRMSTVVLSKNVFDILFCFSFGFCTFIVRNIYIFTTCTNVAQLIALHLHTFFHVCIFTST